MRQRNILIYMYVLCSRNQYTVHTSWRIIQQGEEEEWCLAWVTWGRGAGLGEERTMEQQVMVVRGSHIRNSQGRGLIPQSPPPGDRPPTTGPCPSPSPTCSPLTSAISAMFLVMALQYPGLIMMGKLMTRELPSTLLNMLLMKAPDLRRSRQGLTRPRPGRRENALSAT